MSNHPNGQEAKMTFPDTNATPIDHHYDVVIVGARAAGAATAMLLARAGLDVLAIDKSGYGSDTLSTHALARTGVLLLSRWGVLDTIRDAGTPRANRVVFNYGGDEVAIDVPARGDVDGLYSPRRTVLDRTLVDAAMDAGATVRHNTTVTGVTRDPRGRVTGVEIDDGGVYRTISARFVVGADGMNSRVAQQVGAATLREENGASAYIYSYFTGLPDDVIETDIRNGQAVGFIPTNHGQTCVWVGIPDTGFRAEVADGVEAAFTKAISASALAAPVADATRVDRIRSFPGRPGFVRQSWGSGWALVGDSAYFKDPVSAHGITDAFIGAELLAEALIAATRLGIDEGPALASYQRQRDELAAPMVRAVAKIASYPDDMATVVGAFLDMSSAMREEWNFFEARFAVVAAA